MRTAIRPEVISAPLVCCMLPTVPFPTCVRVAIRSEQPPTTRCILNLRASKFRSSVSFKRGPDVSSDCDCILSLTTCLVVVYQVDAQQAPSAGAQPPGARGGGPSVPTPPPLFFKETWRIMGAPHAIAPGEVVVTNPNLEFKMYGPSAMAADPDKRIWISGPPGPVNIWTGMCTTPFAATLRDKDNYVDLSGLAKVHWTTRASGFHAVRPLIKLVDGTFLVGDHADASTTTFLESEFTFAGLRWMKLNIDRVVTVGRYGPLGEASNWADTPDLSQVDEVGFVDLIPGSGHGSGGYVNVASFEVHGTPVKRGGGH